MQQNKAYGEFFPGKISPFAYNETVANEYFPLNKDEALANGFRWKEEDKKDYLPATSQIADNIKDISDEITKEILACANCSKNYKITGPELAFYRKFNLPAPQLCFGCRHQARMNKRNPRKLFKRNCSNCQAAIESPYAPERPENVYCEKCYLANTI